MKDTDKRVPAVPIALAFVVLGPLVFVAYSIAGATLADVVADVGSQTRVSFFEVRGAALGAIASVGLAAGAVWGVVAGLAVIGLRRAGAGDRRLDRDVALAGATGTAGALLAAVAVLPRSYDIMALVAASGALATMLGVWIVRRIAVRRG